MASRKIAAALCCLAALLAGCGVPGQPLPPLRNIPEPIRDLSARQLGTQVILEFTPPVVTTEGTPIRNLDRLEIYAAFVAADAPAPLMAAEGMLVGSVPAPQIPTNGAVMTYNLPIEKSRLGMKAVYAIQAANQRGVDAGFSNAFSLVLLDLPEPPADLKAALTEPAVILSWTASQESAFGGVAPAADDYDIYRSEPGLPQSFELLASTPAATYEDHTFQFGHHYEYTVAAFRTFGAIKAETPPSQPVELDAKDIFPPAAPQDLRAIAVPGIVELSWSPNSEPDLAGYFVYRRLAGPQAGSQAPVKLNQSALTAPLYRDMTAVAGTLYVYTVTAVDQNGNESPPSEPAAVTTAQ